jgi:hypothetical protein
MQGDCTGLHQTKGGDLHLPKPFHASRIEPSTAGNSSPRVRLAFVFVVALLSCYHGLYTTVVTPTYISVCIVNVFQMYSSQFLIPNWPLMLHLSVLQILKKAVLHRNIPMHSPISIFRVEAPSLCTHLFFSTLCVTIKYTFLALDCMFRPIISHHQVCGLYLSYRMFKMCSCSPLNM